MCIWSVMKHQSHDVVSWTSLVNTSEIGCTERLYLSSSWRISMQLSNEHSKKNILLLHVYLTDGAHANLSDPSCAHAMVKLYCGYFRRWLAELRYTWNGSYMHAHLHWHYYWLMLPSTFLKLVLFFFVFTADENLRWPLPSGALHGLYHRSFHGVPSSRLPQTFPLDVAFHFWDRVQKGMCSCTHRHTRPAACMTPWRASYDYVTIQIWQWLLY